MVIDDEPAVAQVLAQALARLGHEVTVALSGEEGLQLIEQTGPDAVFLDIVMVTMDGIEVLRRIRRAFGDLPVIVLSGWATEEQLQQARQLGATDFVAKPIALRNLPQALARIPPQ